MLSSRKQLVEEAISFRTPERVPIVFWNRDQAEGDILLYHLSLGVPGEGTPNAWDWSTNESQLRGFEAAMMDFVTEPERFAALMDRIIQFECDLMEMAARHGFHGTHSNVMDLAAAGLRWRGRQCFMLPISYQTVSITGSPREIHAEAQRLYRLLGSPKGGFIGYVEEYSVMGMSAENYRACGEAFRSLAPAQLAAGV